MKRPTVKRQTFAIIANPVAGRRQRKRLDAVLQHLKQAGAAAEVLWTRGTGDGKLRAEEAVLKAPDAVVAAGGDGTMNEVLNGMAGSGIPLGILPFGTANVLAAEIGLSSRPKQLVNMLLDGDLLPIRPGLAEPLGKTKDFLSGGETEKVSGGHLFCLMAGVGLDAETIDQVCLRSKRFFGKWAYVRAMMKRLWERPLSDIHLRVDTRHVRGCFAVISKSRCYGGRFVVTPKARLDADHFEICVFSCRSRFSLFRQLVGACFGKHLKMNDVHFLKGHRVIAECAGGSVYQTDGDLRGPLPVGLRIADVTVSLIVPEKCAN